MATPLYPLIEKRVSDATEALIAAQVTPWVFLTAGPPFHVKRFDGRGISYQGRDFSGSAVDVFWGGYIEPFLEDMIVKEINFAISACRDRDIDARRVLPEVNGLLISSCRKVFSQMADIDRKLRGKGYPQSVPLRSVDSELDQITEFVRIHISAELDMWKPRWFENWYKHHQFLVWFIGVLIALAGLAIALK